MKGTRKFSAVIHREGKWYVSLCPELDVASQGKSIEEAMDNLREAVELYLEDNDIDSSDSVPFVTMLEVSCAKTPRPICK